MKAAVSGFDIARLPRVEQSDVPQDSDHFIKSVNLIGAEPERPSCISIQSEIVQEDNPFEIACQMVRDGLKDSPGAGVGHRGGRSRGRVQP